MANNLTLKNHVNERRREPIKNKFISKYIYEEFGSQINDLELVYATFLIVPVLSYVFYCVSTNIAELQFLKKCEKCIAVNKSTNYIDQLFLQNILPLSVFRQSSDVLPSFQMSRSFQLSSCCSLCRHKCNTI